MIFLLIKMRQYYSVPQTLHLWILFQYLLSTLSMGTNMYFFTHDNQIETGVAQAPHASHTVEMDETTTAADTAVTSPAEEHAH